MSRDYARAPCGNQVVSDMKGEKYQYISIIAAQVEKAILAPFVFEGTTDSKLFNYWLKTCLVPELKSGQVVVMIILVFTKALKPRK